MRLNMDNIQSPPDVRGLVKRALYGRWLAGISFVMFTVMTGHVSLRLRIFLVALRQDFGWSRTVLSGAFVFARAQTAWLTPANADYQRS
ncbi:MAG: hypothetical protein BZY79_00285 [SAR202 cluster bacterium Casp-Chloro-G4]|nr:hypothetical protein [Chloroflexota bacterium]PKB62109.1 MAG: hypothetical protein BZY79_00285 [SAR202 cluster bacterium Casp-Chloro-G4]